MPHSTGWRRRRDQRTLEETAIGDVLDGLLREQTFARGLPIGRLAAEWETIVGPRLAAETAPVTLEHGVLVVAASTGAWGAQARFLVDALRDRANEALGADAVKRVQVIVRSDPRKAM